MEPSALRTTPKMQAKISAFFKPQPPKNPSDPQQLLPQNSSPFSAADDPSASGPEHHNLGSSSLSQIIKKAPKECSSVTSLNSISTSTKSLNKKRSYAQLHLELGQSDFLLRTCSTCGFKYACGDEGDEKVHQEFHKDYTHGIQYKGWHNERVVRWPSNEVGRVILVLDGDPPAHKKKVQKVIEMIEMDLGSGWLVHKLCKVYFFIQQKRIAGCLIAEPIKTAYRVLSNTVSSKRINVTNANKDISITSTLKFGGINFQREAGKRVVSDSFSGASGALEEDLMGALLLEEEAVPAICGIRAIWVAPSMRRNRIATQLLDAVRMSFCEGLKLESSHLAFSNPTSSGKALACRYFGTPSFLAYKTDC